MCPQQVWRDKGEALSHITYTLLKVSYHEYWYLGSGCFRHITGENNYLKNIKPYSKFYVTFGDGAKGKIVGKGTLIFSDLPCLNDVLLAEGITSNLINISQLCDQDPSVNLNCSEFIVTDKHQVQLNKGSRSTDNCYIWCPQEKNKPQSCMISMIN